MFDVPLKDVYLVNTELLSDEHMDSLMTSIQEIGVQRPVEVEQTMHGYRVTDGVRRYVAASRLGLTHIPVVVKTTNVIYILEYLGLEGAMTTLFIGYDKDVVMAEGHKFAAAYAVDYGDGIWFDSFQLIRWHLNDQSRYHEYEWNQLTCIPEEFRQRQNEDEDAFWNMEDE